MATGTLSIHDDLDYLYVEVEHYNPMVLALIDTGAEDNLLHPKIYQQIRDAAERASKEIALYVPKRTLVSIQGAPLKTHGLINLTFAIHGHAFQSKFTVTETLNYMVLGRMFWNKFVQITFNNQKQTVGLVPNDQDQRPFDLPFISGYHVKKHAGH